MLIALFTLAAAALPGQSSPAAGAMEHGASPAPAVAPVAMPDVGDADPDAVCFGAMIVAAVKLRQWNQSAMTLDFNAGFFASRIFGRYPGDAALRGAMTKGNARLAALDMGRVVTACNVEVVTRMRQLSTVLNSAK